MTTRTRIPAGLEKAYDRHLDFDFFGLAESDFWDWGFWTESTPTHEDACLNLMDLVTQPCPDRADVVLDVACGKGATTRYLVDRFPGAEVLGINISAPQVAEARRHVPGADFEVMDAVALELDDESVDHVVSIEAAVHFETRREFFAEALRVLRPGGWLVMSDVLMEAWTPLMPRENWVAGPGAYAAQLRRTGFTQVRVDDVREQTWQALADRIEQHVARTPGVGPAQRRAAAAWVDWTDRAVRGYVVVAARKPAFAGPWSGDPR